jgi:two-component system response regulator YesN
MEQPPFFQALLDPDLTLRELAVLAEPPISQSSLSIADYDQSSDATLDARVIEFLRKLETADERRLRLSEQEWADELRLDPAHFGRLILKHTARDFRSWRRLARIRRAAQLLAEHRQHPKSIAFTVGFNDWSHFRRDFRRVVGIWPLQFRSLLIRDQL